MNKLSSSKVIFSGLIEEQVQSLLQKEIEINFNKFLEIDIQGHRVFIMPTKDEIPAVGSIGYDKIDDVLEIRFSTYNNDFQGKYEEIGPYFECLIDNIDNIVGLRIKRLSKLLKINEKVSTDLNIKNIKIFNQSNVMQTDINKRKLMSFKNFIKNDINLVATF